MTKVIVAIATVARRAPDGHLIDYFGEGGTDYLRAFAEGTSEDVIKAHMLTTLNARIAAAGYGPEHYFGPGHMDYESYPDDSEVMWQYETSEVL